MIMNGPILLDMKHPKNLMEATMSFIQLLMVTNDELGKQRQEAIDALDTLHKGGKHPSHAEAQKIIEELRLELDALRIDFEASLRRERTSKEETRKQREINATLINKLNEASIKPQRDWGDFINTAQAASRLMDGIEGERKVPKNPEDIPVFRHRRDLPPAIKGDEVIKDGRKAHEDYIRETQAPARGED